MFAKQHRQELTEEVLRGIPTRVLQRVADLGGLQEVMKQEIEEWDRWSEGTVGDHWSDICIAMAGGVKNLDVYMGEPDEDAAASAV